MNSSFDVRKAERIIGYTFQNPKLLEEALTHSSFADDAISYEQLEFVGDTTLSTALTNHLLWLYPDLNSDDLTKLRRANVSNERLARVAVRHDIYRLVRRNTPGLDKVVEEFTKAIAQESEDDQMHGGSQKKAPDVLAGVVEAIAGAIYKDCQYDLHKMWEVIVKLLEPLITLETFVEQPEITLNELCQKSGKVAKFRFRQESDTTIAIVFVNDQLVAHGSAKQKTIAKKIAARNALGKLNGDMSSLLTQLKKVGDEDVAKQKLNDFCVKRHWPPPTYQLEDEKGPAHDRAYKYSVHVKTTNDDNFTEVGEWRSTIKDAEKSAALKMLSIVAGKGEGGEDKQSSIKRILLPLFFIFIFLLFVGTREENEQSSVLLL